MKAGTSSRRAGSLLIELAARTATVDGKRVELPPTEFSLLAVLAARPGEVVSHRDLLMEAFGDSAYMTRNDLHWRIWKIRALIGDKDREHAILANRRGVGYVIDLPPTAVEVVEGVAPQMVEEPAAVIHLDEPSRADASSEVETGVVDKTYEEPTSREAQVARRGLLRPRSVLAAALIAAVALSGSWIAGYRLSQWGGTAAEDSLRGDREAAPDRSGKAKPDQDRRAERRPGPRKGTNQDRGAATIVTQGGSDGAAAASGDTPSTTEQDSASKPESGSTAKQEAPPPPQPDAQLYHLFNPDSGDHYMTTSSNDSNQKQAAGYNASLEGKVFSQPQEGTVAIALDSGTAHVYRDSTSAPKGVSVSALYRLTKEGDFYYTVSSSQANQAQAQGWSRSTAGYVAT